MNIVELMLISEERFIQTFL